MRCQAESHCCFTYQSLLIPHNTLLLVGIGVVVTLDGSRLAAEKAMESRADLVTAAGLDGVALRAAGLEEGSTLLSVCEKGELAHWPQRRSDSSVCDPSCEAELHWEVPSSEKPRAMSVARIAQPDTPSDI